MAQVKRQAVDRLLSKVARSPNWSEWDFLRDPAAVSERVDAIFADLYNRPRYPSYQSNDQSQSLDPNFFFPTLSQCLSWDWRVDAYAIHGNTSTADFLAPPFDPQPGAGPKQSISSASARLCKRRHCVQDAPSTLSDAELRGLVSKSTSLSSTYQQIRSHQHPPLNLKKSNY